MPLTVKRADLQRWIKPRDFEQPQIDLLRLFDAYKTGELVGQRSN